MRTASNNISHEMVDAAFMNRHEGQAEEPAEVLDVAAAVEDMDDEKTLVYIKTSLRNMLGKSCIPRHHIRSRSNARGSQRKQA